MLTVSILIAGLAVVIVGILAFRLHAFVALILAGVLVALLTPTRLVVRSAQLEKTIKTVEFDAATNQILVGSPLKKPPESYLICCDGKDGKPLAEIGRLVSEVPLEAWAKNLPSLEEDSNSTSICYRYELQEDVPDGDLALISAQDFKAAGDAGGKSFIERLTTGLGSYCGKLAILIVSASIIGVCLLKSGAADRIVRSTLALVGEKNAPVAFVASGFTLSIPVFFDTVFYLMIPLGKALRLRTGNNYLLYVLSIVAGGTMAHSLVPPTPGPLFIAEAFGVPISQMIVGGCVVGLFSSSVGMIYAYWANSKYELNLPEFAEHDQAATAGATSVVAEANPAEGSPGLLVSLVPILMPVILITLGALVESEKFEGVTQWNVAGISVSSDFAGIIKTLGEKNLALLISAIFAVVLYVRSKHPSKDELGAAMQDAVSGAGTIILVTAAGGAFGLMMRRTSVAELLQGLQGTSPVMVIIAAFLVTTAVRTAQGSSTVAMLTAAGVFGGLVVGGGAGVDPLYVALAVGCGSKPVAWMNDSGFWVITRMSGMTEQEGLKYVTPMTAFAALGGLGAVIAGVLLFP